MLLMAVAATRFVPYLVPTLNFNGNKGLRYTIAVDNFNGHYKGELGLWQGERIIKAKTQLDFGNAGLHTLKIRALEPGIVLQKIVVDFGGKKKNFPRTTGKPILLNLTRI